jgi:ABC-type antimicrobial peptide transport system permease subunit
VTAAGILLSIAFFAYVLSNLEMTSNMTFDERARQTWLAVMSVLVAGVGITNSMLMSVTERFREIGTMKCLGAPDNFVVQLFFVEAAFMGFLSSCVGFVVGCGGAVLMLHLGATPFDLTAGKVVNIMCWSIAAGVVITFAAAALRADV